MDFLICALDVKLVLLVTRVFDYDGHAFPRAVKLHLPLDFEDQLGGLSVFCMDEANILDSKNVPSNWIVHILA